MLVTVLLTGAMGMVGFAHAAYAANILDIAPRLPQGRARWCQCCPTSLPTVALMLPGHTFGESLPYISTFCCMMVPIVVHTWHRHSGELFGLSNTIATIAGIVGQVLTGPLLLDVIGCCRMLLDVDGHRWMPLDVIWSHLS